MNSNSFLNVRGLGPDGFDRVEGPIINGVRYITGKLINCKSEPLKKVGEACLKRGNRIASRRAKKAKKSVRKASSAIVGDAIFRLTKLTNSSRGFIFKKPSQTK